jgi:hypothetical protein
MFKDKKLTAQEKTTRKRGHLLNHYFRRRQWLLNQLLLSAYAL